MDQSRETFIKRKDKQKYPICAKSAHNKRNITADQN